MSINEELLQKFMDCKLSDEERAELEKQLTEEELTRLKNDKAFQDALAEKLKNAPCCPDPLWEKLKGEMMGEAVAEASDKKPPHWLSLAALLAVCVGLVFMIVFNESGRDGKFVSDVFLLDDIESYARQADVQGSQTALVKNLHRNGFRDITFGPDTVVDKHPIIPLGIRYVTYKKKRVAQVLFDCCSKPVIILIAPKDLPVHEEPVRFADGTDSTIMTKDIGGYKVIGGAQKHTPEEVMKLFAAVSTSAAHVH